MFKPVPCNTAYREERTYTGTATTPPADSVNSPSTSSIQDYTVNSPPINPTPHLYLWVMQRSVPWVMWVAVTGVQWTHYRGLLQHTLAKGALVYSSQGRKYHAEGCLAVGVATALLYTIP
jgi:hypothetical protein